MACLGGDQPVCPHLAESEFPEVKHIKLTLPQRRPVILATFMINLKRKTEILLPQFQYPRAMTTLAHLIE